MNTEEKQSILSRVREFMTIAGLEPGDLLYRKDILTYCSDLRQSYIDCTRRKLTKSGFLSDGERQGKEGVAYRILRNIPETLTCSQLDKMYDASFSR